ncbi:tyrosine decarboxylase MfnA [Archaeoglobales archaeon ex4484_92]|nr:MAG: tyrosine decarboxylase MfnA [Archaeoglobales archaeon ex4484_92]
MDIIEELKYYRSRDIPYSRVLSSMCTIPHPIAVKAHQMFIETNLGDPGIFRGTVELESKVIEILGGILHNKNATGYICSGGTEANIQGIRAARNIRKEKRGKLNIVVPKTAHFSFEKIADMLRLEIRRAGVDDEYRVDVGEVERLIDDSTVAIVGIAGTTELGQIDPIVELSEIAVERNIELHVDAAFGGLVIPFLENPYPFDFRNEGVSSITLDPHKMGMATIPAGGILFKDEKYLRALEVETPYLTSRTQYTLTGTRPGTGVAAAYAVLKSLGFDGLRRIVRKCMQITRVLVEEMESLGFEKVIEPVMNVVAFKTERAEEIKNEMYRRRWVVSTIKEPCGLRFVIMPHIGEETIMNFIDDLKKVCGVVKWR